MDTVPQEDKEDLLEILKNEFESKLRENIFSISSISGENLVQMKRQLFEMIKKFDEEIK
jgi:DNA polymerase III delta prime subunit